MARNATFYSSSIYSHILAHRYFSVDGVTLPVTAWLFSKALVTGENVLGCCGDEHLKRCLNDLEVSSERWVSISGNRKGISYVGKGLHV